MSGAHVNGTTPRRRVVRLLSDSRVLGCLVSIVLLISACGPKTEIVYISLAPSVAGHEEE